MMLMMRPDDRFLHQRVGAGGGSLPGQLGVAHEGVLVVSCAWRSLSTSVVRATGARWVPKSGRKTQVRRMPKRMIAAATLAVTRAVGLTTLLPELVAVTAANVAAAIIRFGILRTWVFRPDFGTHLAPVALTTDVDNDLHAQETTRTPS